LEQLITSFPVAGVHEWEAGKMCIEEVGVVVKLGARPSNLTT